MASSPTVEELQKRVGNLEQALLRCMQGVQQVRRDDARAAIVGMALSGVVFGLVGYLAGSRSGMRVAREMTEGRAETGP
jgi:hypothetical protein